MSTIEQAEKKLTIILIPPLIVSFIILHCAFGVLIKIWEITDRNAVENMLMVSTVSMIFSCALLIIVFTSDLLKTLIAYVGSKTHKRGTKEV